MREGETFQKFWVSWRHGGLTRKTQGGGLTKLRGLAKLSGWGPGASKMGGGATPSNMVDTKKLAIGGSIFGGGGFKGAKLTKISCVRFLFFPNDRYNFLQIGAKFPQMVPLLFVIFYTFLQ